jgi:hypothetical protein
VPAGCQRLVLKVASQTPQPIEAADEESTQLARWPLQAYAEIQVGRHVPLLMFSRNSPCFHWKRVICTNRGYWSSCFALVSSILTCLLVITAGSAHHHGCCSNYAMLALSIELCAYSPKTTRCSVRNYVSPKMKNTGRGMSCIWT